jgi:hypothetical protein
MYSDRPQPTPRGLTVADLVLRYRVSPDKIRAWINRGELSAVNTATALCGRPRWVVNPDSLAAFEQRRASSPPPQPQKRKKKTGFVDYFPD